MKHIPDAVTDAMNATGLPWQIVFGSRHIKLVLNGRLVGVLPYCGSKGQEIKNRSGRNLLAQIRRTARTMEHQA